MLQFGQTFLYRTLELRIMPGDDFFRPVLNLDIRGDPFILNRPFAFRSKESTAGAVL